MIRPVDSSSWRVASTTVFNGSQENHFQSTSLHLSFTEYYIPVHLTGQQSQDSQIFYLESYVSVYDTGKWVGDVDILQALLNPSVIRARSTCIHNSNIESRPYGSRTDLELVSAESWHDILDPPLEAFVVRAHGNWVARLAALAMLPLILPQDPPQNVVICPRWMCWMCETTNADVFGPSGSDGANPNYCPPMARNRAYIY